MTQEEKQLLFKDLCARLPYGVRVKISDKDILLVENNEKGTLDGKETISDNNFVIKCDKNSWIISCDGFKPYLRPMSSMTEEEHEQYMDFMLWSYNDYDATTTTCVDKERINEYKEFIYSHHLDDCGLIPMGLALEAPEGMYN